MKLRRPEERLAGCCWLPRFIDKARSFRAAELPRLYKAAFGSRIGIDGYFLHHFALSKSEFLKATIRYKDDGKMAAWFTSLDQVSEKSINQWNAFALNLGKKGHPGYMTRHLLKFVMYPKSVQFPVDSLFEAIHQDESTFPP